MPFKRKPAYPKKLNIAFTTIILIMLAVVKRALGERRAQSEWSSVYMLIVLIIAALLLIAVIKPMFKQSQSIVQKTQPKAS